MEHLFYKRIVSFFQHHFLLELIKNVGTVTRIKWTTEVKVAEGYLGGMRSV